MQRKIVFGKWEAAWLVANMITTKLVLHFVHVLDETAGNAAWLLSIYLFILANITFFFIIKLFKRFPGKDIIDISSEIGGTPLRLITGILVLSALMYFNFLYLREFSEHMKVIAFTVSPLSYIMTFLAVGITVACFIGIEAITRLYAIGLPILAVSLITIGSMSIKYWDFSNALPILGLGADKILFDGFPNISSYTELIFLFFLPPFLVSFKELKSAGYTALIISGITLTLFSVSYILTFPYPTSTENFLPLYQITRLLEYGRFIQRIEPIFMVFWSFTALFYLSTSVYFTIYLFSKIFNLPYLRPLIPPFILLSFNIAFLPHSLTETFYKYSSIFYTYSGAITFLLPLVLLLTSVLLKKGGKVCID